MEDYFATLTNPFLLDVSEHCTDLGAVQQRLQDPIRWDRLRTFIHAKFPHGRPFDTNLFWFEERLKRHTQQVLIDVSMGLLPIQTLYKVGNGGDGTCCVVCYTSLGNNRHAAAMGIYDSLVHVGFNGHFLLMEGGYPCPTGKELPYAGVPYAFKIFAMLEAEKRGFSKVLWVDAACVACQSPQKLFDILDDRPTLFRAFNHDRFGTYAGCVLPQALDLLSAMTGANVRGCRKVVAMIFGLDMKHTAIRRFIDDYYATVRVGLPFFSLYPEEVVFSCILAKPEYADIFCAWPEAHRLFINEAQCSYELASSYGYYFLQRKYQGSFGHKEI